MPVLDLGESPRSLAVVVDSPGWFDVFGRALVDEALRRGERAMFHRRSSDIPPCDIVFYLSCLKLTPPEVLRRHRLNVVVHASALPHGRGFSPAVWQVLEGRATIPITMIEAVEAADAGDILLRDEIRLAGHELNDEIRAMLGSKIVGMCLELLTRRSIQAHPQVGEPSWYPRRRPVDSELSPHLTLAEQFDLLRVCDNERYPAFFDHLGHRYLLTIAKDRSGH